MSTKNVVHSLPKQHLKLRRTFLADQQHAAQVLHLAHTQQRERVGGGGDWGRGADLHLHIEYVGRFSRDPASNISEMEFHF